MRSDAGEWPIPYEAHARYYPEAATILEVDHTSHLDPLRPFDADTELAYKPFFLSPAVKFNLKYGDVLERHERIDVLLDKTVVALEHAGGRVSAARVRASEAPAEPASNIEADTFVVACGGVGNPRLLLLSGIGPAGGVGRYFMCHPHIDVSRRSPRIELDQRAIEGVVTVRDRIDHALQLSDRVHRAAGASLHGGLVPDRSRRGQPPARPPPTAHSRHAPRSPWR